MQYKPTRSLCATVAIVATLALGSTPAFAQETAPAVSVPTAAPAPVIAVPPPVAAAPTVSVPPVTVQPTAPQPEAAAAEPARAEPAPRQAATPRRAAAPAASVPVASAPAAAAPVDTAPVVPAAAPAESALQTPLDTAAPAPVAEVPAPVAEADNGGLTGEEAGFLALLAAIGLGGVAFLVMGMRRRRRMASDVEVHDYAPEPAAAAGLQQPVVLTETPVRADPVYDVADHPAQPAMASAAMIAPRSAPAASFMISDDDDRQDLIERMVAAEPDEANPFTSPKARRRRARLILQARENGQPDDAAKPFDWRSYEPSRRREPSELTPA